MGTRLKDQYLIPSVADYILQGLGTSSLGPLPVGTTIGQRIGTGSAHGAIYELDSDSRKVIKVVIKTQPFQKEFFNEVKVGRTPGIEQVGTRIYQAFYQEQREHRPRRWMGVYVMDHLKSGDSENEVITLRTYWEQYWKKETCPTSQDRILKMYVDLIFNFYKITRGWHGDLHSDNIQVIMNNGVVTRMYVIDYGSHTPFKNNSNLNKMTCLDQVLDKIENNWAMMNTRTYDNFNNKPFGPWPLIHREPKGGGQFIHQNKAAFESEKMHPLYRLAYGRGLTGNGTPFSHRLDNNFNKLKL